MSITDITAGGPAKMQVLSSTCSRRRLNGLLAELQRVLVDVNPEISDVQVHLNVDDRDASMPLLITARWVTGSYEGDGDYWGGGNWTRDTRFRVSRMNGWLINGEQAYSVIEVGETDTSKWMELSQTGLECFIGKKIKPSLVSALTPQ